MIPPSLFTLSYYFQAVEIWEDVPAEQPGSDACGEGPSAESNADAQAAALQNDISANEAAGALPSMRRVFKGIEYQAFQIWDTEANPAWTTWSDNKRDESNDRARDRNRNPLPPLPHLLAGEQDEDNPAAPAPRTDTDPA